MVLTSTERWYSVDAEGAGLFRIGERLEKGTTLGTSPAGEPVRTVLTAAPGNGQPFGGIKVIAESGWFAARPSGTEDVYKIYAESFRSEAHLRQIQQEAQSAIDKAFRG